MGDGRFHFSVLNQKVLLHVGKVWLLLIPLLNLLHSHLGWLGFSRHCLLMLQRSVLSFCRCCCRFQSNNLMWLSHGSALCLR